MPTRSNQKDQKLAVKNPVLYEEIEKVARDYIICWLKLRKGTPHPDQRKSMNSEEVAHPLTSMILKDKTRDIKAIFLAYNDYISYYESYSKFSLEDQKESNANGVKQCFLDSWKEALGPEVEDFLESEEENAQHA